MKIIDVLEEKINKFLKKSQENPNKQLKAFKKCPKEGQEKTTVEENEDLKMKIESIKKIETEGLLEMESLGK